MPTFKLRRPSQIVLIGGGDVMLSTAQLSLREGLRTYVILAPRHAEEELSDGSNTFDAFASLGITPTVIPDINAGEFTGADWNAAECLGLCFGPAWIFSPSVRAAFGLGLINYNPIPVPRYLGGAHYTWQILNGDQDGACVLQLITDRLDRGPILKSVSFRLPDAARTPADYFAVYNDFGRKMMAQFVLELKIEHELDMLPFDTVEADRVYFPRLRTARNGFIDWDWSGLDIERFCCAFDKPYDGAKTFVGDLQVSILDVTLSKSESFHPYMSGLVIRSHNGIPFVAVKDGMLRIGLVRRKDGTDMTCLVREGVRFFTPNAILESARAYRPTFTGVSRDAD